jgi:hypothetical protein
MDFKKCTIADNIYTLEEEPYETQLVKVMFTVQCAMLHVLYGHIMRMRFTFYFILIRECSLYFPC